MLFATLLITRNSTRYFLLAPRNATQYLLFAPLLALVTRDPQRSLPLATLLSTIQPLVMPIQPRGSVWYWQRHSTLGIPKL